MNDRLNCEYCTRPILRDLIKKTIRGKLHIFCSEFCFRLFIYDVPTISYHDLNEMYKLRCVNINSPNFKSLIVDED
jgi:hypothetical protein